MGIPSDMDNSYMLSIIEQKMCTDDRKVWSRELEQDGKKAVAASEHQGRMKCQENSDR